MNVQSKIGLAVLAISLSCGPVFAEEGPHDPAVGSGGRELTGPGGPGDPSSGELVEPDGPRGPRDLGAERGDHRQREFGLSRLLNDPEIRQKVGISSEQVAKIRQQELTFRKSEIRQRADLEVKRIDLRELLEADKSDRVAIDRQLQEISTSQLAMAKLRVDFRLNMKDALTPEQREKLKQALRDRSQGRGGPGRRGPGGRGPRTGGPATGTEQDGPAQAKPRE